MTPVDGAMAADAGSGVDGRSGSVLLEPGPVTGDRLEAGYRGLLGRRLAILVGLAMALLASFAVDVFWGPSGMRLEEVVSALFSPDSASVAHRVIIWNVRLPLALMALAVGASLSLAGAEMQTILNNPLASPFTLGISSAAAFGASLTIVFGVTLVDGLGDYVIPANAFIFAALCMMLILALCRMRGMSVESVVLFGIALVFTFQSLLSLVQFVATAQALQQVVFWTMGSLGKATWDRFYILAVVLLACVPFSLHQSWKMTALRLGEERAVSMGINVERMRTLTMLRISLLASLAVSFVGIIGFVGLVGPHIARMLLGEDHRFFLPGSILSGALILSLASIASKAIIPGIIIPVGIVTSLVGIPLFLALILGRRRRQWQD